MSARWHRTVSVRPPPSPSLSMLSRDSFPKLPRDTTVIYSAQNGGSRFSVWVSLAVTQLSSLPLPASRSHAPVQLQLVSDNVRNGLRVGSRARTTAVNVVAQLCQLVRHAVGHIGAGERKRQKRRGSGTRATERRRRKRTRGNGALSCLGAKSRYPLPRQLA